MKSQTAIHVGNGNAILWKTNNRTNGIIWRIRDNAAPKMSHRPILIMKGLRRFNEDEPADFNSDSNAGNVLH